MEGESPEIETKLPPEMVKASTESIEMDLFRLNRFDRVEAGQMEEVKGTLAEVDRELKQLERDYPKEGDVKILRQMYTDLAKDFEGAQALQLDSSLFEISEEAKTLFAEKGVQRGVPENSTLSAHVAQLEALGIHPDYVVHPTPPSDRTVILFMQVHTAPGITAELRDKLGVTASQTQIKKESEKIINAGLTRLQYLEGFVAFNDFGAGNLAANDDENGSAIATMRLEKQYGESLDTEGVEDRDLLQDNWVHIMDPNTRLLRGTAQNIFIAENVADQFLHSDQNMALLAFGAAHESLQLTGDSSPHPVPLSEALAYYGCNVVVVDAASPYTNMQKIQESQKELEDVLKEMQKGRKP
jgi:hypothetical protein